MRSVEIMSLPDLNQHKLNFLSARSRAEPSKQTNKPQTVQKTHICTISRKQKNGGKGSGEEGDKHLNKDPKMNPTQKNCSFPEGGGEQTVRVECAEILFSASLVRRDSVFEICLAKLQNSAP